MKPNCETFLERSPLFPGTSCFPLSPDQTVAKAESPYPYSENDQLNIIFSILGTQ